MYIRGLIPRKSASAELAEEVPIAVKLRVTSVASRDTLTRILQFVVQKLKWYCIANSHFANFTPCEELVPKRHFWKI